MAKGFNLEECEPLLKAACMSDEENAVDNNGRKIIKRYRPHWRPEKVKYA
jgi:hypothetical protein